MLAWVAAGAFFIAASWSHISESQLLFMGLQNLSTPHVGWPLTLIAVIIALFLSFPSFLSRDRLLACARFALYLFLVITFYVSPAYGVMFVFIGGNIVRENAMANSALNPDAQERHAG